MKDIEIIYPNDDDPRKERPDILTQIDNLFEAQTRQGEVKPDIRTLAEEMGIGSVDLRALVNTNPGFKEGLDNLTRILEANLLDEDPWLNRIDVSLLRWLIVDFATPKDE